MLSCGAEQPSQVLVCNALPQQRPGGCTSSANRHLLPAARPARLPLSSLSTRLQEDGRPEPVWRALHHVAAHVSDEHGGHRACALLRLLLHLLSVVHLRAPREQVGKRDAVRPDAHPAVPAAPAGCRCDTNSKQYACSLPRQAGQGLATTPRSRASTASPRPQVPHPGAHLAGPLAGRLGHGLVTGPEPHAQAAALLAALVVEGLWRQYRQ